MKQLITRTFSLILLLVTLCAGTALADRFRDQYLDEPTPEVLRHIQEHYPDDLLEDYILIKGTSKGDYGFALLSQGGERTLVGYRSGDDGMKYWFRNAKAVPQGEGYAFFERHHPRGYVCQWNSSAEWGNDLGFSVIRVDKAHEEYWAQSLSYHWRNGAFQLYTYMDNEATYESAYVTDSGVRYYSATHDRHIGRVSGTVQRDLRYVSFPSLPKTCKEARQQLTVAPEIPDGELTAERIKFTGGKRYEVYSAPSETSLRGGSGKAAVSTNDWIQVFGAEDGYILIQYAIDSEQMRFGYIEESALPKDASVKPLSWRNTAAYLTQGIALTDDPLNSRQPLMTLGQDHQVTLLGVMGSWAYIETSSADWARGFVPMSALRFDAVYDLASHSEGKASGTLTVGTDRRITLDMTVSMADAPMWFLLTDVDHVQLGYAAAVEGRPGVYRMQGSLRVDTTCVRFIPVGQDGTQGAELFHVAW